MGKKVFKPDEWRKDSHERRRTETNGGERRKTETNRGGETWEKVVNVVEAIEASRIDITASYEDWRNIGFALADEFGEGGRELYHRVSAFYAGYNEREADKQYSYCLKSNGKGVTIGTFFELAKRAGIVLAKQIRMTALGGRETHGNGQSVKRIEIEEELCFARELCENLPPMLHKIVSMANSDEDADLLLLGSIVTLSACLPQVYGTYAERNVYPNLFLFVSAQASAGKGRLSLCRRLVEPIHRMMRATGEREWKEYQHTLKRYMASPNKEDIETPEEPRQRMLIIPANASATSMFQILSDNDECGLIFETEGDTLAQTFRSEHGNYSDGFRKAFHHEPISYVRRKNREHVEVREPRLSAVLSGTPRQIQTLITDAENGLFSRFIFYTMKLRLEWIDVFGESKEGTLDLRFDALAEKFKSLYLFLKEQGRPMRFVVSAEQKNAFNKFFEALQLECAERYGKAFVGTVRRLGLMTFRMSMVLTTLRLVEGHVYTPVLECSDEDFQSAMRMAEKLVKHAAIVFSELSAKPTVELRCEKGEEILSCLQERFTRAEFLNEAEKHGIRRATAKRYLTSMKECGDIACEERGEYVKLV